jgi:hypothetical protein
MMTVLLELFLVLFVGVVTVIVLSIVRRRRAAEAAGLDPFAADIQMAARVSHSQVFDPKVSVERGLAELDDLRQRGVITSQEHRAARDSALGIT